MDRKKVLQRIDLPEDLPAHQEALLREKLNGEYGADSSQWELDPGEFTPYKGENPATRAVDLEGYEQSILANSILLSDGGTNEKAVPVAEASEIFRTLIDKRFRLRRLFCDPALKNAIDKIVQDTLKSHQHDLPLFQ